MSNFKNFINLTRQKYSQSSSQELATKISASLVASTVSISNSDSNKFGNEVVNIANSDSVLSELSDSIGNPKKLESEDEFVNRAKSTLTSILKRKLIE